MIPVPAGPIGPVLRLAALQRAVRELGDLTVIPLKGIELAFGYYASPSARPMSDVDVLVPRGYARALRALEGAGFWVESRGFSASNVRAKGLGAEVDVHRMLLPPWMGALDARAVFARARPDRTTFGVPVWRLDPADLFVHLCANYAKDRFPPDRRALLAADLAVVLPHTSAGVVAQTSRGAALRGTAWLALRDVRNVDPALAAVCDAVAPGRARRAELRSLREGVERLRERSYELSFALARASCDGLARPALSVAMSLARGVRDGLRASSRTASAR